MMADHLVDDEAQEFLGEIGIELGIRRQLPQPHYLCRLAPRIGRRQLQLGLQLAHRLRHAEPLGQYRHQRRVDIVDALSIACQPIVHVPPFELQYLQA